MNAEENNQCPQCGRVLWLSANGQSICPQCKWSGPWPGIKAEELKRLAESTYYREFPSTEDATGGFP